MGQDWDGLGRTWQDKTGQPGQYVAAIFNMIG